MSQLPMAWGHLKPNVFPPKRASIELQLEAPGLSAELRRVAGVLPRRIALELPLPPSKNRLTRRMRVKGGGYRDYPAPAKVAFVKAVKLAGLRFTPIEGPVSVVLRVYQGRTPKGLPQHCDLPNYEEILFDALEGVAYRNDRQLRRVLSELLRDDARPRVEVTIEELR